MKIGRDLLAYNSLKNKEGVNGVGANSVTDSDYIFVDLEDKNRGSEDDMDLSMIAPVESSDCEEDEEERYRGTNNGELDNTEDVDPSEEPSCSFQVRHKRKSNVLAEQNAKCSEADKKMESNKVSNKKCIKCNIAIGVATKVCKLCGEAQPMKRKLQKKIKKYGEAWASAPMENGNLNNLFDETNLLLHKWQLLGMYPLFLLGGKRRSKTVTQCMCPIKFKHPQNKEAQDIMRQIFVGLINAQQTAFKPIVTKAPAQPPVPQLQLIQPQRALQPVIPSLIAQQVPVFQSLVQLPVTLCSTPRTITDKRENVAHPERQLSSGSFKGHSKARPNFLDGKRPKRNPECCTADGGMNEALPAKEHPCYHSPPLSDSATAPVEMFGPHTSISPLAAMEPPVFPNTPVQSKSVVGENHQNILLEVLNYCKFLHSAVERLEQKIDRQMSYEQRYQRCSARFNSGPKRQSKVPTEGEHLSCALAQRLGPPIQRHQQWIPPWKRSAVQQGPSRADLQVNNSNLQSARPSGSGRGKGRGKGRGRRGRSNGSKRQSQTPDPVEQTSELLRGGMFTAEVDDPQPSKVMKKTSQLFKDSERKQKRRKALEGDRDHSESEIFRKVVTLETDVDKKVMIGSSMRKVWIPLSVYKEAFKESEPQKALVPVLHSLFSNSILSCSAVTGNPDKGIKQLDPNKIEALREFLAEMYPQYDVSLRGVTWAMCVGVINNITKDLRKKS